MKPALIAALEKSAGADSNLACHLGEIGSPDAFPAIERAAESGDFELQKIASWALTKLGSRDVEALLKMATNRDQPGRSYFITALGANSIASATALLLQILEEPNQGKWARRQTAHSLGRIGGSPRILQIPLAMLQESDEDVRMGALLGLGALHDSSAYNAIVEHVGRASHRQTAIIALGELGDPRASELLIPMLESGDDNSALHAATALGKIGCHEALPSLIQLRDRMAASDSPVLKAYRNTVEGVILKLKSD